MNYTKILKGKRGIKYKYSLKDISIGRYEVLRNKHNDYFLIDINYRNEKYPSLRYKLNEYTSYLLNE